MKLLTKAITTKLQNNHGGKPVVKFFNPTGAGTWFISELFEDGDTLFGLCDLGMGTPEIGTVSLSELASFRGRFGLGIERDQWFKGEKTLLEYQEDMEAGIHI